MTITDGLPMMGTHRRTAFVDLLPGSVASAVPGQTTFPVLFHH